MSSPASVGATRSSSRCRFHPDCCSQQTSSSGTSLKGRLPTLAKRECSRIDRLRNRPHCPPPGSQKDSRGSRLLLARIAHWAFQIHQTTAASVMPSQSMRVLFSSQNWIKTETTATSVRPFPSTSGPLPVELWCRALHSAALPQRLLCSSPRRRSALRRPKAFRL